MSFFLTQIVTMDKSMALYRQALAINKKAIANKEDKAVIFAGLGWPTFPTPISLSEAAINYWQNLKAKTLVAQQFIEKKAEHLAEWQEKLLHQAAIPYGDPKGDSCALTLMAKALNNWYETDKLIKADNLLFTVGGSSAINLVLTLFKNINAKFITTLPYYSLYVNAKTDITFNFVNLMENKGYRLSAISLFSTIEQVYQPGIPCVLFLSDPHNPLGTCLRQEEFIIIVDMLTTYPNLYLVLDSAYEGIRYQTQSSLLKTISENTPALLKQLIILCSATKGLSAAGERMALILGFDENIMSCLLTLNINTIAHVPLSLQYVYAMAMLNFSKKDVKKMAHFYKHKVNLMQAFLKETGIAMSDPNYHIEGTFYVLADLSELIGIPISCAIAEFLQKPTHRWYIETSSDIAAYLLLEYRLMLNPGENFGLPAHKGFIRITCSGPDWELKQIRERLAACLQAVRCALARKKDRRLSDSTEKL